MGGEDYKKLVVLLLVILASCVKDKPVDRNITSAYNKGNVYVVCEGSFGSGDASLYMYDPIKDSVFGDMYTTANGKSAGDVFQSMTRIGNQFFLCINNSDKVIITEAVSGKYVTEISIPKPRYILPVSPTKAYVSTLYSNKIYIINPVAHSISGVLELPFMNPEGMCLYNESAFVCPWDTSGSSIIKIDVATDKIVQTVRVAGYAPQTPILDKEQMLWVLAGNQSKGRSATLTRLDPSTGNILRSYIFPDKADVLKPVFNIGRDTLYFLEVNYYGGTSNNGVFRMGIHETTLPASPFIAAQPYQYFWSLGIEPATGHIYAGDPKGFTQKGIVYQYRQDGTQLSSFHVGIGPGHFYFDDY